MQILTTASELSAALGACRNKGDVGLVPTMGALHDGHRSLILQAARENPTVVVSIFVNPLQFGDEADLALYPRDLEGDARIAQSAGASLVFAPAVEEIYPPPLRTTLHVAGIGEILEGVSRPGHFDGVATVLARLFGLVGPATAYFGEKDFQQVAVVRTVVRELRLPIAVRACPTVRAADGLALSSRNGRLGPEGRRAATALHRALSAGAALVAAGEGDTAAVAEALGRVLADEPGVETDYVAVVDPESLVPPTVIAGPVRLLVAARVDGVRLIDNCLARPGG